LTFAAIATGIGWAFGLLALIGALYAALSGALMLRFFAGRRRPASASTLKAGAGGVSILKPLHGWEPGLREDLASHFRQETAGPVEVVLGARDPEDPALQVAEAVIGDHPDVPSQLCRGAPDLGRNRKVSNLVNMADHAHGEVLVLSDSDIGAPPDHVARVLSALEEPGVGVVTCPYFGVAETGFWPRFAAMGVSYDFLPKVIAGVSLGLATPCMGSTIALRRETLEAIGGFRAFQDVLADDYAIGAAVRAAGLKSVVAPVLVSHSCAEPDFRSVFAHELRWSKTVKRLDPLGHAGAVIAHPLALATLAAIFLGFSPAALAVLVVSFASRIWLKATVDRMIGKGTGPWWLILPRDALSLGVFAASFLVQTVEWRGQRFRVAANGELVPI
jgi:ceramide glucosyltransferase